MYKVSLILTLFVGKTFSIKYQIQHQLERQKTVAQTIGQDAVTFFGTVVLT